MNVDDLKDFVHETQEVAGWFSIHDAAVFELILSMQTSGGVQGDILEIGVFEGKSAVLIGRHLQKGEEFHVCDIFDEETDSKNLEEIEHSYPELSRKKFEKNALKFLGFVPIVHQCPSSDLPARLGGKRFRFIHIDGSHLYHHVKVDLDYATHALISGSGVIALDDFRSQHTIGVTTAVWESIFAGTLIPLILTPAKMYLGRPNAKLNVMEVQSGLASLGIECVIEDILGRQVLRTVGLQDSNLYSQNRRLVSYVPPILIEALRKSYLWKRLRSR